MLLALWLKVAASVEVVVDVVEETGAVGEMLDDDLEAISAAHKITGACGGDRCVVFPQASSSF